MLLGAAASGELFQQANTAAAAAAAAGHSPDMSGMRSGSGCQTSPSSLLGAGEEASGGCVALKVACGDMVGTLLVHRARIVINEGTEDEKEVSPTEFERLGGRSATKKWKQSIRLVAEDGELGRPVGEWYVIQGLEQPKKPREPKDGALLGCNNSAACPSPPLPDRSSKPAAASKAPAVHKRPMRAAARNVERHIAAEAASSPELAPTPIQVRASRRGGRGAARAAAAAAAAMAWSQAGLENAASGTGELPDVVVDAAAAAADGGGGGSMLLPEQAAWNSQQQQQLCGGSLPSAASHGMHAAADEAAISDATAAALDAAAQGDYQLPPGATEAAAALPSPLPGDASQAVIEMTAYLEGRRASPPWRLLPLSQRPLVGRYLVPLRQLLVLVSDLARDGVMRTGGYVAIKDDLLLWQDLASQLGLPAWPCTEVPDPLRALQQVYRDYLLRFESRFSLPEQPAAAAAAGAHHSPSLSTGTQYASGEQQQQQQEGGVGAAAAPAMLLSAQSYAVSSVSGAQQQQQQHGVLPLEMGRQCSAPAAMAAVAADNNNFNNSLMQPGQQRLQAQFSLTAGMVLDDAVSGDLFDLLTDLIPDNDAVLPAASSGMQQQQQGDAAGSGVPLQRQHPEMSLVQQRQRLQQLQAQLLQQQQQQQGLVAALQLGPAAARAKRPPPLIRCGDSDVVSLMDQTEVNRLLRDYEQQQVPAPSQQQEQQRQHHPALRQQHQSPMRQATASLQGIARRPAAGQLAAAVAGAVDLGQSQDLQALMQSYWQRQGQGQQQDAAAPAQQQQQQQQQHSSEAGSEFEPQLEPEAAGDEMSGMLEALQLAADGQPLNGEQQQQRPTEQLRWSLLLLAPKDDAGSGEGREAAWGGHLMPARANLLAQGSVGAHLVSMVPAAGAPDGSGGSSSSSGQHAQAGSVPPLNSSQAMPAPPPRPANAAAAAAAGGSSSNTNYSSQSQQQQGEPGLLAFEGGLLRLTTPNSALIGSVLDSPMMRNLGGGGGSAAWMDMPEQLLPARMISNDLRSMVAELTGAGAQGGASEDESAAALQMW
ncbi:hypothetical protein COO60DRAFT_1695650 [Scenedesmus sp. NREL 46B-D3]|nr:hypothetical protein COO60DRAFT_1695650 [Scenedesmus sp. NREL 46B-D3]